MSKRRLKKLPFNAPSRTYEKYEANLERSKSDETSRRSVDEEPPSEQSNTDATIPSNVVPRYGSSGWEPPKWLGHAAVYITIILFVVGIVAFFWSMNSSLIETKRDVSDVSSKVQAVDTDLRGLTRENAQNHNEVDRFFAELLSKFDRILDRLPNQNQILTPPSSQEGIKSSR